MFENVGKKLKTITKVFFYITEGGFFLASAISLFTAAANELMDLFLALVLLLIGVPLVMFFIWVSYLFVYGFCELVDKTTQTDEDIAALEEQMIQVKNNVYDIKTVMCRQLQQQTEE